MRKVAYILIMNILPLFGFSTTVFSKSKLEAKFSGKILIEGRAADSVTFTLRSEYFYNYLNDRKISIVCDEFGNFKVTIPMQKEVEMVEITFFGYKKVHFPRQYIENGDNVTVNYTSAYPQKVFVGRGSAKYNCLNEINYLGSFENFQKLIKDSVFNNDIGVDGYESIVGARPRFKHLKKEKESVLDKYRASISHPIQSIIEGNIDTEYKGAIVSRIGTQYLKTKDSRILSYFNGCISSFTNPMIDTSLISLSESQIGYFYNLSRTKLILQKGTIKRSINEMFNQILSDYDGTIAERVLTYYLIANPSGDADEYQKALVDVTSIFRNTKAIELIEKRIESSSVNTLLFDFELSDSIGKTFVNKDFYGKVLLIDFWFTGCIPCLRLAKVIHDDVYPVFKGSNDVIFLTINLDKKRDVWINSLKEGLYTTPKSINLWIGDQAFNHAFMKHYGIVGLPKLFIVNKEGKIQSTNHSQESSAIIETLNSLRSN